MNNKQQDGSALVRLTAAIIGAAGSFSLFAAYMVIPPAGLFSGLLAPFPASFLRFRYGRASAAIVVLGAAALMTAVFGIQAGALYLAQCGAVALILPELLSRGFGAARSMVWTTAANLLVYCLAVLVITVITGHNLHQMAAKEINDSIAQAIGIYEKAGITGDELAQLKQSMGLVASVIIKIYPALMTVMLMAMAGVNLALIRRFAARCGYETVIGDFNKFRNPDQLIWLLIAAGFALLAGNPLVTIPALNVLVILTVVYFLQGMAVISSILARQAIGVVLRVGLYMMLLFQPYLMVLVAAIGVFDLWGDFRTPRKQENL